MPGVAGADPAAARGEAGADHHPGRAQLTPAGPPACRLLARDGTELKSSTGSASNEEIKLDGRYMPGTYRITVLGCTSVAAHYELAGELTYVVA